ncbi:VOC family protein [Sediminitomix flava]|uniref:Catechol 2,3-dioxygenase-like lactoylglutathione lyase family enzyme n=1 Tax=Sediminitomix flava TaxID=379075 RepID=A0A315ZA27_SEDFL|nr:VOC family protein [Sediminitomix flava]PWJ42180.1 catechol 2,3-dioxygenase-like lactoylglutathione lyase family enzyme [Sediminitomix flava]
MINGIKKMDHVGITVPDLAQASLYFKEWFDAEIIGEAWGFKSDDYWMKDYLNVHPRAEIHNIQMMKLPDGTVLELFEYESPDQNVEYPKNSDHGGHHLAFEVDNIDEVVKVLHQNNVPVHGHEATFNDPSADNTKGSFKNIKWIYFQTPWGMDIELVQKL